VVYADNLIHGRKGRHLVSIHVLDDAHAKTAVLSKEKTDMAPDSSGKLLLAHTGDTQPGFSHPAGQGMSVDPTIAAQPGFPQRLPDAANHFPGREEPASLPEFQADTPEQARLLSMARQSPDALIPTGEAGADGKPVQARLADLLQKAGETERQAKTETAAFNAAVTCALRFPE
jgi:hypothetical protein